MHLRRGRELKNNLFHPTYRIVNSKLSVTTYGKDSEIKIDFLEGKNARALWKISKREI